MTNWVWKQRNCQVDVLQQGEEVMHDKVCSGVFHEEEFNLFQIHFSAEEVAKLKSTGNSTFSLRSHLPKIVDIPKDLTFTLR